MALDETQVRLAVTGNIYKAPVGTTLPTTLAAPSAPFVELGYLEAGPSMSVDVSTERFTPWQAFHPVRETITAQTITASFTLWQRNPETLKAAWGGGAVTAGTGVTIFTPPATATVNEGAFLIDVEDGTIDDRYVISRASISLGGDISFNKDGVTGYPITLTYLQPASGSAWQLITNDPAVTADA